MKNDEQAAKLAEALRILAEAIEQVQGILGGKPEGKVTVAAVPEGLLTEEQLRVALNFPNIYAVRELRQKKKIPFVRLGYRTIRYSLPRVLKALEKLEVKEAGLRLRKL